MLQFPLNIGEINYDSETLAPFPIGYVYSFMYTLMYS